MRRLPKYLKQHEITIEPHLGVDGYGRDRWGPPVEVKGLLDDTVKEARGPDGSVVVSSARFLCDLDTVAPARSRGTLPSGRKPLVLLVQHVDGGALPVPSHLSITFE